MRVIIVGAGLAGLRTASRLRAAAVDVEVIEAAHRPGGRVRTVSAPFVDGQHAESGAEWVDSHHHRMAELLDRFGIRRVGEGEQWTTIRRWLHVDGNLLDPAAVRARDPAMFEQLDEFDHIVAAAADGIVDPARPCLHPDARAIDARSLADVARDAGLGELASLFKRRDAQGEFAAEPAEVSLLFVAQQRAHQATQGGGAVVRANRVEGGFSRLADALAAELHEVVAYGEAMVGFEHGADHVVVRTSRRTLEADHLVLACSLVPLRTAAVTPGWPDSLGAAVGELGYGTVTKTAVQWPGRGWPAGYATTSGRAQRVYEPTKDQPGVAGILMCYCGGAGGHEWAALGEDERLRVAADEMQAMQRLGDEPLGGFSRAWSTEARYGGSYAVYQPGQVTAHWDVLRSPWGRVHLAGEHVATCTGYMEGALESGDTVAARLLDGR